MLTLKTTVCLSIIHAAHLPERRASMARLRAALFPLPPWVTNNREHNEREPSRQWGPRSWGWALETGAEFSLSVNDDVLPPPRDVFWGALEAMLHVLPRHAVLGLGTVDPLLSVAHGKGERWLRLDHASTVGWGVGLWREELELLYREERALPPGHRSPHSHDECPPDCYLWHEDSWSNLVFDQASPRRYVWHPVPAILDHDTSIPSTFQGHDNHKARRPSVTWRDFPWLDLTRVEFWRQDT